MAQVIYTDATAKKFIKPDYIVATLFTGEETDDTPQGDAFVLEDVIQDTTSLSQDDNETTDIDCETSDSPIISIVSLGKWQLAAEIGDTQKDLLCALAGFVNDGDKTYAPASYQKQYTRLDIVFTNEDGTMTAYVCPKVQLNSKLLIEELSSNLGRISLAGTAQNVTVTVNDKQIRVPFWVEDNYTLPTAS